MERFLSPRELSRLTDLSENTLAAWRSRKTPHAPRYIKLGRRVRYAESDVRAWLASRPSVDGRQEQGGDR